MLFIYQVKYDSVSLPSEILIVLLPSKIFELLNLIYILKKHYAFHIYKLQERYKKCIAFEQNFWKTQFQNTVSCIIILLISSFNIVLCKSVCSKIQCILYIHIRLYMYLRSSLVHDFLLSIHQFVAFLHLLGLSIQNN